MKPSLSLVLSSACLVLSGAWNVAKAAPTSTKITYQGQLKDGGVPVNDTCDMVFALWDRADPNDPAAELIGGPVVFEGPGPNAVQVRNGLFNVELDFGKDAWLGSVQYLGMMARCPVAVGPYTELSPRQLITAVPYALQLNGVSVDAAKNVGIGTDDPLSALHLRNIGNWNWDGGWGDFSLSNGTVGLSIGVATAGGGTGDVRIWPTGGTERLFFGNRTDDVIMTLDNGNVGIGTTTPAHALDVFGTGGFGSAQGQVTMGSDPNAYIELREGNDSGSPYIDFSNDSATDFDARIVLAGDDSLTILGANVGIGTTAPGSSLEVNGGIRARGGPPGANGVNNNGYAFAGNGGDDDSGVFSSVDGSLEFYSNSLERMRIIGNGNVGIGTNDPQAKLHVASSGDYQIALGKTTPGYSNIVFTRANGLFDSSLSYDNVNDLLYLANGSVARLVITDSGNVGIGTPTPQTLLDVNGELTLRDARTNVTGFDGAGNHWFRASIGDDSDVLFGIRNGPGLANDLIVKGALEIQGGADLAEPFDVHGDGAEPGSVVVIDPDRPGQLKLSGKAYDRTVAGIISGAGGVQTGMVMGQQGSIADGSQKVALTGRVYCWCDVSNGAIQPGDLLTTSSSPGHAMKVTDHPQAQGAIIGKAMTALESGNGLVLVLVSLQ